jgi:hypothetical protein
LISAIRLPTLVRDGGPLQAQSPTIDPPFTRIHPAVTAAHPRGLPSSVVEVGGCAIFEESTA